MSASDLVVSLLPEPQVVQQYESIAPGFLKWHMNMIEQEARHSREAEQAAYAFDMARLEAETQIIKRGQLSGFGIGIFTVAAGAVTATMGAEIGGAFIGTAGVTGLVAVFVFGRKGKMAESGQDAQKMG